LRGLALMLLALAIVGAVLAWRALSGSRAPPSRA
jgi:hypothetical protein